MKKKPNLDKKYIPVVSIDDLRRVPDSLKIFNNSPQWLFRKKLKNDLQVPLKCQRKGAEG